MGLRLEDGTERIFLNTQGENEDEVSEELREFLHYIEHTTDEVASQAKSPSVHRIHERVRKVKSSEEAGVKYMQAWEERYYEREEGREEGRAEGEILKLKKQLQTKRGKGKSAAEIAEDLEESEETIQKLIEEIDT